MNLAKLLKSTHTMIPDNLIAIRYATFEDLANVLEAIVGPYKKNIPGRRGPDGQATHAGIDPSLPQLGAFPGIIVLMLGGHQFIRLSLRVNEKEVAPLTDKDATSIREAAASLAWCRGGAVLLPPLAQKYNLDGAFDEAAGATADIFKHQGIMCYRPSAWQRL